MRPSEPNLSFFLRQEYTNLDPQNIRLFEVLSPKDMCVFYKLVTP